MFSYIFTILLIFTISNISKAQFLPQYGPFGTFQTPGFLNPYIGPGGGFGMTLGFDPLMIPSMGMNLFGNSLLMNQYLPPFGFMSNGNSFTGYGIPKYGSALYSRKRFIPGVGCLNRSGCIGSFQKKH